MAHWKLTGEIERVLRRVVEGNSEFDSTWDKVHNAPSQHLKEKYEGELKRELKKLQRHREQIKGWLLSSEVKDKTRLMRSRRSIERQMERFKVYERDSKTKAYSKEGLKKLFAAQMREDPRLKTYKWIQEMQGKLQVQIEELEHEMDRVRAPRGRRGNRENREKFDELQNEICVHQWHVSELKKIESRLKSGDITIRQVKRIEENLTWYIDSWNEPDFVLDEYMYEAIDDTDSEVEDGETDAKADDGDDTTGGSGDPAATETVIKPVKAKLAKATTSKVKTGKAKSTTTTTSRKAKPSPFKVSSTHASTKAKAASSDKKETAQQCAGAAKTKASTARRSESARRQKQIGAASPASGDPPPDEQKALNGRDKTAKVTKRSSSADTSRRVGVAPVENGSQSQVGTWRGRLQQVSSAPGSVRGEVSPKTGPMAPLLDTISSTQPAPGARTRSRSEATPRGRRGLGNPLSAARDPRARSPPDASPTSRAAIQGSTTSTPRYAPLDAETSPSAQSQTAMSTTSAPLPEPRRPGSDARRWWPNGRALSVQGGGRSPRSGGGTVWAVLGRGGDEKNVKSAAAEALRYRSCLDLLTASMRMAPDARDTHRSKSFAPRNPFRTPLSFPSSPREEFSNTAKAPAAFRRLSEDTLFFIFYFEQGTQHQYLAARELKARSWRYHKKFATWFTRHNAPTYTDDSCERGNYVCFDEGWRPRIRSNFTFEYSELEDEFRV